MLLSYKFKLPAMIYILVTQTFKRMFGAHNELPFFYIPTLLLLELQPLIQFILRYMTLGLYFALFKIVTCCCKGKHTSIYEDLELDTRPDKVYY